MKNIPEKRNYKNLGILIGFVVVLLAAGADVAAQVRDPFLKPVIVPKKAPAPKPDAAKVPKPKPEKPVPPPIVPLSPPPVEMRIDQYKALKKLCDERGIRCPKPISVLLLEEVQVTGIFYTPRGYSAMVEATPIQLSYTVYPGEKFFNGQLVAIEENRLIFRKVTKMSDGKIITVAENKGLRQDESSSMSPGIEVAGGKNAALPLQIASTGLGVLDLPVPQPVKPVTAADEAVKPTNGKRKTAKFRSAPKAGKETETLPPVSGEEFPAPKVKVGHLVQGNPDSAPEPKTEIPEVRSGVRPVEKQSPSKEAKSGGEPAPPKEAQPAVKKGKGKPKK